MLQKVTAALSIIAILLGWGYWVMSNVALKSDLSTLATKDEILSANNKAQSLFLDIRISQEQEKLQALSEKTLEGKLLVDYTNLQLSIKELKAERMKLL